MQKPGTDSTGRNCKVPRSLRVDTLRELALGFCPVHCCICRRVDNHFRMVTTYTSRNGLRVRNIEISMRTSNQLHAIRHTGYQRLPQLATGTDYKDSHGLIPG